MSCKDMTVQQTIETIASKSIEITGGGASALVASIGAALANFVCNISKDKKNANAEELIRLSEVLEDIQNTAIVLMDRDYEYFKPLSDAYGLSKDCENREYAIETNLMIACTVPMHIIKLCCQTIDTAFMVINHTKGTILSDLACTAILCKAAMQCASVNVIVNAKSMKDEHSRDFILAKMRAMTNTYIDKADMLYDAICMSVCEPQKGK